MQKLIIGLLLAALSLQAESRTIKDQVESAPVFSDVKVGLLDGAEVRGRLVKFEAEELVLRVQEGNTFTDRTIQLSQVKSFKENKPGWLKRTAENVGMAVATPFLLVAFFFWMIFNGGFGI
jgi:hypothetical protein